MFFFVAGGAFLLWFAWGGAGVRVCLLGASGLVWFGLVLVWFWFGFGLVLVWFWFGFGLVLVWFWFGFGLVWFWFGLVWFWFGFVCLCLRWHPRFVIWLQASPLCGAAPTFLCRRKEK
ncbi:hypothetical protein [Paraburkholderia terrae]|uniref:hypothetical protein n=1 Tax=Paraburkholderia terrae TaxID=311230 RepID=UPI001EE256A8|nr:hypothetical protein [Paraburkholderia terrae]GJH01750.1 hypothetical protein CBA19C8_14355 [Paraburkholderia terrae]